MQKTEKNKVICYKLIYAIPVLVGDESYKIWRDSIYIYNYKNYNLIKFPIYVENQYSKIIIDKFTSDNKILIDSTLELIDYNYLFYKNKDLSGYFITDSLGSKNKKLVSIDSFLLKNIFWTVRFFNPLEDSIVEEKKYLSPNFYLIQKSVSKLKKTDAIEDTTILYYSNEFKNIKFSFNKYLDSMNGLKLYKIIIKYNNRFSNQLNKYLPEHYLLFEMKIERPKDINTVKSFFDKCEL
jgi:hypothetical protein